MRRKTSTVGCPVAARCRDPVLWPGIPARLPAGISGANEYNAGWTEKANVKATLVTVCLAAVVGCNHSRLFDSSEWKAASTYGGDGTPTVRQRMVRDVVDHVLPGKTREEIEQLLGPSLDAPYFSSTGRN